ncbi:cell wall binding repeat 2 family protein [Clostridioides difficile Y307]|uniref:cell wall-binding repeat-containing protein n=1 Tax=Clostridioides difficile TaxID=1496 RepID=UPI00038CDF0C|nr:cell wall binding repeat 2 family protein [Clostridioides difficile Y307]
MDALTAMLVQQLLITICQTKSYIIGGTATLSSNLESKLSNPTRLAGSNRNETNAKIIDKFYPSSDLKYAFVVKDGSKSQGDLIDGLAVGALGAKTIFR